MGRGPTKLGLLALSVMLAGESCGGESSADYRQSGTGGLGGNGGSVVQSGGAGANAGGTGGAGANGDSPMQSGGTGSALATERTEHFGGTTGQTDAPSNGNTCICRLAESLNSTTTGTKYVAGCSSTFPNDCTLQKAYCGELCAGQPVSCGTDCIATFDAKGFIDGTAYTSGSCRVIIRCP